MIRVTVAAGMAGGESAPARLGHAFRPCRSGHGIKPQQDDRRRRVRLALRKQAKVAIVGQDRAVLAPRPRHEARVAFATRYLGNGDDVVARLPQRRNHEPVAILVRENPHQSTSTRICSSASRAAA
jgi:hypothetical protein